MEKFMLQNINSSDNYTNEDFSLWDLRNNVLWFDDGTRLKRKKLY